MSSLELHNNDTPTEDLPYESDPEAEVEHESSFKLTITLHNKPISLPIYNPDATIQDLSHLVASDLHIPAENQKFLITPKIGLLKPPFKINPDLRLQTLLDKKIVLLGATSTEINDITAAIAERESRASARRAALQAGRRVKPTQYRDSKKIQDEARYTFHTLRPLPHLPNPEKSLRFLQRLRDDVGIKAAMRKHGFAVGLLTEMDPAMHTTHESRTLGLNRNRGEVIELRLRTDAYDGYRDYYVIRKTLCHELTHNVWGDHDSRFWNLCKQIEAEVDANDYRRHGHAVSADEFYNPNDNPEDLDVHDHVDAGGWEGGEFVLGTGRSNSHGSSPPDPTLSRREILARAAEERVKKQKAATAKPPPSGSTPSPGDSQA